MYIMSVLLLLFICLSASFRGITTESNLNNERDDLGKGVYLRKTNILGDFQERETVVFERFPNTCLTTKKLHYSGAKWEYFKTTQSFYSKVAIGAGLDVSLGTYYTLGFTLGFFTESEQSERYNVSGMFLNMATLTRKIVLESNCLVDDRSARFTKRFFRDLEKLPLTINKPWLANSWKQYNLFLERYGSHVVTSVSHGSSITQTAFAQSYYSYNRREFEINCCIKLAGPTIGLDLGVCSNYSEGDIAKATKMNTMNKLIIRGGTEETRSALLRERTMELIAKLMVEAGEAGTGVEHSFRSIWHILQTRYEIGSDNYIRAVNLQYYYLGYLNYGCRLQVSGGLTLQKFDYSGSSSKESPEFSCTLAREGCHSNRDCRYEIGVYCSCAGRSCVRYKSEVQNTGTFKLTAYINTAKWKWHGCNWKVAGSICACYNPDLWHRKVVWSLPIRYAVKEGGARGDQHKADPSEDEKRRDPGLDWIELNSPDQSRNDAAY